MKLFLIGPPGSGKGTYSREISSKYGFVHIEPGRMLREEMAKGSEIGKEIEPFMNAGQIPPVRITLKLVEKKFREEGKKGAVFDGFPRNMAQVELSEKFVKPDLVINLVVPREILIEKIISRLSCQKCGEIYNLAGIERKIDGVEYSLPPILPKKEGICDKCGSVLAKRSDEAVEIIETRLRVHDEQAKPLIKYYEKLGILENVNVTSGKETMLKMIYDVIERKIR